mmetsp:Transcript_48245/g.76274  ORF Transcript_48245/g.76274 Transcript_48245/m.76274 type:complete len:235 (-) Transcript_48245:2405-3109(-)
MVYGSVLERCQRGHHEGLVEVSSLHLLEVPHVATHLHQLDCLSCSLFFSHHHHHVGHHYYDANYRHHLCWKTTSNLYRGPGYDHGHQSYDHHHHDANHRHHHDDHHHHHGDHRPTDLPQQDARDDHLPNDLPQHAQHDLHHRHRHCAGVPRSLFPWHAASQLPCLPSHAFPSLSLPSLLSAFSSSLLLPFAALLLLLPLAAVYDVPPLCGVPPSYVFPPLLSRVFSFPLPVALS